MTYYIPSKDIVVNTAFPYEDILGEKAFNKYLRTLQLVGYIDSVLSNTLIVYSFLKEYEDSHSEIEDEIKKIIYNTLYCIESKSCLFN